MKHWITLRRSESEPNSSFPFRKGASMISEYIGFHDHHRSDAVVCTGTEVVTETSLPGDMLSIPMGRMHVLELV